MSGLLELWGRGNAYKVQKALWLLAELDLEFRHHDVGSRQGDLETPEFLALNPQARIPVLVDDEAIVWESNTVLRYLANRFEARQLYPEDALPRSQVERWMDWAACSRPSSTCSGGITEPRRKPATRSRSTLRNDVANTSSRYWIDSCRTALTWRATISAWPTLPVASACIVTSTWAWKWRARRKSAAGINACRNAPRFGIPLCSPLTSSKGAPNSEITGV